MRNKMIIFNESGKGYWMEGVGCLRAEGENRPSRPGHIVILNDQGGSVMDTSEDVTATLRAQDHGHPPVICFEPGIARREGSESRFVPDRSVTLRAQMGDNQPAVCYALDHVITTGAQTTAKGPCVYKDICPTEKAGGVHAVCYPINLMVATRGGRDDMRTCFGIGDPDDPQFTLSSAHEHGVCYMVGKNE